MKKFTPRQIGALVALACTLGLVVPLVRETYIVRPAQAEAKRASEEKMSITQACDKYYAELVNQGGDSLRNGTVRATYMLDKLRCDVQARVTGDTTPQR